MGMYEKMDCIKKLLAFSADELSTAEDYVDMMKMAQDQSMYNKFKEIANQELIHYEYDYQTALAMMYKMKQDGEIEDINEIISSYVNENNLSWKNKILWKMQNTKMQPK